MDEETRALLKKKHEAALAKEAEKSAKFLKEEAERIAKEETIREMERVETELKLADENSRIDEFISRLRSSILSLENSLDLSSNLELIACEIDDNIELIKKHNRMMNLNEIIVSLVEILNGLHAYSHKTPAEVKQIKEAVQQIFNICGLEIEIEEMDTTADIKAAELLQAQEYGDHPEHYYYHGAGGGGAIGGAIGGAAEEMPPLEAYSGNVEIESGNVITQTGEQ